MATENPFFDRPILNSPYACPVFSRMIDKAGEA
jgi:hypothetical protein